jgi:hypothetical protein
VATVIVLDGYEVRVFTRDHSPPHVHVYKGDAHMKIDLAPIALVESIGASAREERRAVEVVAHHIDAFLAMWRKYHG